MLFHLSFLLWSYLRQEDKCVLYSFMSTKMEVPLQSELTECLVNAKQWLLCMGENLIDQGYVSGPWEAPSLAGGTRPLQIVFSMWYVQFSSVTQSCPTLWNPMDCSMPGVAVLHQARSLGKLMSIELVIPSNHLILCHPLLLLPSIFPSNRVFSFLFFFLLIVFIFYFIF